MNTNILSDKGICAGLIPTQTRGYRPRKMTHSLKAAILLGMTVATTIHAAETIVSDSFSVEGVGTGFAPGKGVNTGINPPNTRLTGTAAEDLRYLQTVRNRPASHFEIDGKRLRVKKGNKISRFTFSADGQKPFDFGPALRTDHASKKDKLVYDIRISMRNEAKTPARFTFGLSTTEGEISQLDFALQLYRAKQEDSFYTIKKRFDRGSYNGATTPNDEGDLNAIMNTTAPGTAGKMIDFLIRVTDAGAEGAFVYNSRLQVSVDDGATWMYDTASDSDLPNGFRLDGTSRYFVFDQAVNSSGDVFYDDFSVTVISSPKE